jgi:DNA-3-methyladenine glycosylase
MFGEAGHAYVYFIYGMYHCLNTVTEPAGRGAAVLIRAARAVSGWSDPPPLGGPGRLCRALGIDLSMNGWDLTDSPLRILEAPAVGLASVVEGPRVGIRRAVDLPLRFRVLR